MGNVKRLLCPIPDCLALSDGDYERVEVVEVSVDAEPGLVGGLGNEERGGESGRVRNHAAQSLD